ncbi:Uncharacterised protein [Serratia ficaria]|nr:Uncharacterised protein [Serratia ficaria]
MICFCIQVLDFYQPFRFEMFGGRRYIGRHNIRALGNVISINPILTTVKRIHQASDNHMRFTFPAHAINFHFKLDERHQI